MLDFPGIVLGADRQKYSPRGQHFHDVEAIFLDREAGRPVFAQDPAPQRPVQIEYRTLDLPSPRLQDGHLPNEMTGEHPCALTGRMVEHPVGTVRVNDEGLAVL